MDPRRLLTNTFIKSSALVITISTLVNFLNYLFNLIMGRLLNPTQFGEVATLVGLSMIISVPAASLTTLMARQTSTLHAKSNPVQIFQLFSTSSQSVFLLASLATLIFWALIPFLAQFLHISLYPILIFSFLLPLSMLTALNLEIGRASCRERV